MICCFNNCVHVPELTASPLTTRQLTTRQLVNQATGSQATGSQFLVNQTSGSQSPSSQPTGSQTHTHTHIHTARAVVETCVKWIFYVFLVPSQASITKWWNKGISSLATRGLRPPPTRGSHCGEASWSAPMRQHVYMRAEWTLTSTKKFRRIPPKNTRLGYEG